MKGHIVSSFFLMGIFAACTTTVKQATEPVDYAAMVNPFIGTDFTGNTYPGAQAPFGMVQLSPDNGLGGWNRISGYYYPDSTIASFSHTHKRVRHPFQILSCGRKGQCRLLSGEASGLWH